MPRCGRDSEHGGFALGSAGAFLVIESRAHAQARGAKPYARLTNVVADLAHRKQPGEVTATLEKLWSKLGKLAGKGAIITGATGAEPVTSEERAFLGGIRILRCGRPARCSATPWKPSFRWDLGWPRSRSRAARCFRPTIRPGWRLKCPTPPTQIVVIGAGHWRGEGMALVEAIR